MPVGRRPLGDVTAAYFVMSEISQDVIKSLCRRKKPWIQDSTETVESTSARRLAKL